MSKFCVYSYYYDIYLFLYLCNIVVHSCSITIQIIAMRRCCYLFTHAKHFLYTNVGHVLHLEKAQKFNGRIIPIFSSLSFLTMYIYTYSLHLKAVVITLYYLSLINMVYCVSNLISLSLFPKSRQDKLLRILSIKK